MIRLIRPATIPVVLTSKAVLDFRKRLGEYYSLPPSKKAQKRSEWMSDGLVSKIITQVSKVLLNKCSYCERQLEPEELTFDHFRPVSSARGYNKEYSEKHYWWLVCEWNNMLLCCAECNSNKSTWFPVKGKRAPVKASATVLKKEEPLLVNPFTDDPAEHLSFSDDGMLNALTEKGTATLEILQLNRKSLVHQRLSEVQEIEDNITLLSGLPEFDKDTVHVFRKVLRVLKSVYESLGPAKSFLAYKRYYYSRYYINQQTRELLFNKKKEFSQLFVLQKEVENAMARYLRKAGAKTKNEQVFLKPTTKGRIFIEKVTIKNFKGINYLDLEFPEYTLPLKKGKLNSEPWLVILGENGMGKSSILQAIALGLAGQQYIKKLKLNSRELVRLNNNGKAEDTGEITVFFRGERKEVVIRIDEKGIHSNLMSPAGLVLGYGAARMPKIRNLKPEARTNMVRAENLFFHDTSLIDHNAWLCSLSQGYFDRVAKALKELMGMNNEDRIIRDVKAQKIYKADPDKKITIDSLSDGYRSVFSLACDIMEKLVKEGTSIEVAEGVVLIDEIGTHLHPRWRMQVVNRLRSVFPRVQFIVTTHDPLCLKGTRKDEVIVVSRPPELGEIHLIKSLPDPGPLRADQLLASEYFGLSTTIDPESEEIFNEYYFILALKEIRELTKHEAERLEILQKNLDEQNLMGNSERENMMFRVIDKAIVEKRLSADKETRVIIDEQTIKSLEEILNGDNV